MSNESEKLNSCKKELDKKIDKEIDKESDKDIIAESAVEGSDDKYLESVDTKAVTVEAFTVEDNPLYMINAIDSDNANLRVSLVNGDQESNEDTMEKSTVKEINRHVTIEEPGIVRGKFKQTVKHYSAASVQQVPIDGCGNELADRTRKVKDKTVKERKICGLLARFRIIGDKLEIKGLRFLIIWLVLLVLFIFLLGFWVGRHSVFKDFSDLDTTLEDPILVSDTVVTMSGMNWDYLQSDSYSPNDKYNQIYFGAQLFAADDYIVYISDDEGKQYHTTLTQCKLAVNDEDINDVHIKFFKGVDHPFIIFNMDSNEFIQNVGAEFMPSYTDAMRYFVYQYLAETLPFSNSTEEN